VVSADRVVLVGVLLVAGGGGRGLEVRGADVETGGMGVLVEMGGVGVLVETGGGGGEGTVEEATDCRFRLLANVQHISCS
jgi:hypothetical protein